MKLFRKVIDLGGEPITGEEYYSQGLGRITEFKYCNHIADAFRRNFQLKNLANFGESAYTYSHHVPLTRWHPFRQSNIFLGGVYIYGVVLADNLRV